MNLVGNRINQKICDFYIRDMKDLITLSNVNRMFRDIIDTDPYSIWKRVLSQENFVKAAKINYTAIFLKTSHINYPPVDVLPILHEAFMNGNIVFIRIASKALKINNKLKLFVGCCYGLLDFVMDVANENPEYFDIDYNRFLGPMGPSRDLPRDRLAFADLMYNKSYPNINEEMNSDTDGFDWEIDYATVDRASEHMFFTTNITPFSLVCKHGYKDIFDFFFDSGVKFDPCQSVGDGDIGITYHQLAINNGHRDIFLSLIKKEIFPEFPNGTLFEDEESYKFFCRFLEIDYDLEEEIDEENPDVEEIVKSISDAHKVMRLCVIYGDVNFYKYFLKEVVIERETESFFIITVQGRKSGLRINKSDRPILYESLTSK